MSTRCWVVYLMSMVLLLVNPLLQVEAENKAQPRQRVTPKQAVNSEWKDDIRTLIEALNKVQPTQRVTPKQLANREWKDDFRTTIMPPIREGETAKPDVVPNDARILHALRPTTKEPGVYEEFRDDIKIVKKCLVNKVDPPRFFPLVGRAQLHRCRWKCTVSFNETIVVSWPFPFDITQPRKAVVYIDLDHLHRVSEEQERVKSGYVP